MTLKPTATRSLLAVASLVSAALGSTACETSNVPLCDPGEVRYSGRPPRKLFAYDKTCRDDCFSLPRDSSCDPECSDVHLESPTGVLTNDRSLILLDTESLGQPKALAYAFGYLDETGGDAPQGWGFLAAGPQTYLSDERDGTARFVIETQVIEVEPDPTGDLWVAAAVVSEVIESRPGRVEILTADDTQLVGRFFLGYETTTGQPQGEVLGCFNLGLSEPIAGQGTSYRVLTREPTTR